MSELGRCSPHDAQDADPERVASASQNGWPAPGVASRRDAEKMLAEAAGLR
nr:hypothetical protein [uncultured Lichenicoccus sp.]